MRICFLTRDLDGGGAERQLLLLARGLVRTGHEVAVLPFYGTGEEAELRILPLAKKGRWDLIGFLARLVAGLRRESPDVLFAYLPVPNALAVLLRPLFPRMRIVLGVRGSAMELHRYDRLSRVAPRLEAALAGFSDRIVANSESGRRAAVERGLPENRITVIRNAVDTEVFRRDEAAGRQWRAALGFEPHHVVIGVVGRLDPMKDHATFIAAFRAALRNEPSLRGVIVGDGPSRGVLEAESSDLPILWLGRRSDMVAVYSGLDLLCLSSAFGEGMPNAVAESMACETPCVVTDVGDSVLLVGDTGLTVPPREPVALARALLGMARTDRAGLGRRARRRIEGFFSVDRLVSETLEVLASFDAQRS